MTSRKNWSATICASAILIATVCGCGSNDTDTTGNAGRPMPSDPVPASEVNTEVKGEIKVDGSSTVYPISEAVIAGFGKRYPNINIPLGQSGTGSGFKRFIKGETEVSDASRPIKMEEFEALREAKIPFIEIPVAYDGLTLVVHKDNDWVDQLTVEDLQKIFTVAGAATKWSDVRPSWPDRKINIFAPGTASGTFDYFKEVVAGDEGQLRSDMSTSEDDNVLVTGVAGSPDAIGFFGVAYFEENQDKLRAVPIVNPETGEAISPTSETIESGAYAPFSRPLFIYVASNSLGRPDVKLFVKYYLDNAPQLAGSTGYVALPEEIYAAAAKNVRARKTGTHYWTAEGEKRSGSITEIYQEPNRLEF
jgi:phosphate transport system substrate-binding protein